MLSALNSTSSSFGARRQRRVRRQRTLQPAAAEAILQCVTFLPLVFVLELWYDTLQARARIIVAPETYQVLG